MKLINGLGLVLGGVLFAGCVVPLKYPPIVVDPAANQPKIDFGHLAEFAEASANAYETDTAIIAAYGDKNVMVRPLPGSDGKYFIVFNHRDKTQTISVRGTANKSNAQVDINSIKVLDGNLGIYVHRGFKDATEELLADVKPFLQTDYKTRITGHSLGGAMACLLMMHFLIEGIPVDQVLTFGQPKVTNEEGGAHYKDVPFFRIINDQDLVPHVPPSNVVFDLSGTYQHFGPEITLLPDKKFTYSPAHIPKDYVTGNNWKNLTLTNGTDHQSKNYVDRIKALK